MGNVLKRYNGTSWETVGGAVLGVNDSYSTSTSQAYSCNYVNSIVESGSNTNGSWVKYIDGTMICYKTISKTVSVTSSWGSIYESGEITLGDFPQEFIAIPVVNITVQNENNIGGMIELVKNITTQSAGKTLLVRGTTTTNANYIFNIVAIGKWK